MEGRREKVFNLGSCSRTAPEGLAELRGVLLREHERRRGEGL